MHIRNIRKIIVNHSAVLSADIEFENTGSKQLYFSLEKENADLLVEDATPFVASVLVPCMMTGENIKVYGKMSKKLNDSLPEIMELLTYWNPNLKKIEIECEGYETDRWKGASNASFFSGGVDSFYTLLKKRMPEDAISHAIFVQGLDIEPENDELFDTALNNIDQVIKTVKKQVITVRTNIREFTDPIVEWDWAYGAALASIALCLRKRFKNILIAGAKSWDQLLPNGSHPDLDKLWSTECLSIEQDGNEFTRLEKVKYIADHPGVLKHIRVCCRNYKGIYNCCECEKCLRTMIALFIAGKLDESDAFPKPIDLEKVRNLYLAGLGNRIMMQENLDGLKKQNLAPELQEALRGSINSSKNIGFKQRIFQLLRNFDKKHNKRRFYRLFFKRDKNNNRKMSFILLSRIGLIR